MPPPPPPPLPSPGLSHHDVAMRRMLATAMLAMLMISTMPRHRSAPGHHCACSRPLCLPAGGCFGAVVVDSRTGEIVGEGRNRVLSESDPTCELAAKGRLRSGVVDGGAGLNPTASSPASASIWHSVVLPLLLKAQHRMPLPSVSCPPCLLPPSSSRSGHGEMEAIRQACKKAGSPHLHGCILYTSAHPCPM